MGPSSPGEPAFGSGLGSGEAEVDADDERDSLPPSSRALGGPITPRDTDATPFTSILQALLERVPGAYAAALVDSQGETVDYTGRGDPFDLRVAAAHLQLVLQGVARFGAFGNPQWVVVRGERKSVAVTALPEGYALAVMLRSRSAFTISTRALRACARALAEEAGWKLVHPRDKRAWYPVLVETDPRGRPLTVRGAPAAPAAAGAPDGPPVEDASTPATATEVLGVVTGLSVRERGFRVRTGRGGELTLVREAGGRWYADEAMAGEPDPQGKLQGNAGGGARSAGPRTGERRGHPEGTIREGAADHEAPGVGRVRPACEKS